MAGSCGPFKGSLRGFLRTNFGHRCPSYFFFPYFPYFPYFLTLFPLISVFVKPRPMGVVGDFGHRCLWDVTCTVTVDIYKLKKK